MKKNSIKKIAEGFDVTSFLDYKELIRSLYLRVKREMNGYSYQKFAADLGFSENNFLQHVVAGRRPLTMKAVKSVVASLGFKGLQRQYLETLVQYGNAKKLAERDTLFVKLLRLKEQSLPTEEDKEKLEYFSNWHHVVIGELCAVQAFKADDPYAILRSLIPPLKPEEVRTSVEALQRLGVIEMDAVTGRLRRTEKETSTSDEARGMSIVRFHQQMIDHAKDAITRVPQEDREISSVTLRLSEAKFQKVKSLIHQFERLVLAEEDVTTAEDRIYQVNVQLFPFSQRLKKE